MSESNALATFEFPKNKGLFTTFEDGDEYKIRVLTLDPVVSTREFEGADGTINLSTKFAFIIYNFTLEKAQILNAGATITKEIQRIHQDPDFGANIKNVDIKIAASGSKLTRKYSVQVLPKAETLTNEQIKECAALKLDEIVKDGQRMSLYDPNAKSGYEKAQEARAALGISENTPEVTDEEVEEEIDLSSIPFN